MRTSTTFIFLFLAGCGSISIDEGLDQANDSGTANDARNADAPSNGGPSVDAATTDEGKPPIDGSNDDVRATNDATWIDSSSSDISITDAGTSRPDVNIDDGPAPPIDAPKIDVVTGDTGTKDTTTGDGRVADTIIAVDAAEAGVIDVGCVAETDQQLCTRLGKSCEIVSGVDNCGVARTPNCGTCTGGMACVEHVCKTPVCSSLNYSLAINTGLSVGGQQEYLIAANFSGQSVIVVRSPVGDCATTTTYLGDETSPGSGAYTLRDISTWWNTNSVSWADLSADGLTLVTTSTDRKIMATARRSAVQLIDFTAPVNTDFVSVNGFLAGTNGLFSGHAMSFNGLEFYYGITGISTAADGVYRATRTSVGSAFAVGTRVSTIDGAYTTVSGISSDALTLFTSKDWAGYVFTRSSTSTDFVNPNGANTPPQLTGWSHRPTRNCTTLLATNSPGGCGNQDIVNLMRQ
jgi:hypothetical protein